MVQLEAANIIWSEVGWGISQPTEQPPQPRGAAVLPPPPTLGPASCVSSVRLLHCKLGPVAVARIMASIVSDGV